MRRSARAAVVAALAVLLSGASAAPAVAQQVECPAGPQAGGGDPYFPCAGNRGYDVKHYDLDLDYKPAAKELTARAIIAATASQRLTSFNLDLRDLAVKSVSVNGTAATFAQQPGELVVTPRRPLAARLPFVVTVEYGGTMGQPTDNTGALYGWVAFGDGAFVANEPEGASTWYPVNDLPYDKATYSFAITVPEGTVGVANGKLLSQRTTNGETTFRWVALEPMASYLSMAASGNYELTTQPGPRGLPIVNAVDKDLTPAQKATVAERLGLQPQMIEFFETQFGRYPFGSFGAVIDDNREPGYALENQTRPIYSGVPRESTIAHELAHQWYGDKVTPKQWRDIWLNEGFATYAEWLWGEKRGTTTPKAGFEAVYATPADDPFWTVKVADPGATGLFDAAVYDRGGAFLYALRHTIGDVAFATLLKRWADRNLTTPATTEDLEKLAEQIHGQQLDGLFDAWLYTPTKPPLPPGLQVTPNTDPAAIARTAGIADAPAAESAPAAATVDAPAADEPTLHRRR